MTLDQIPLGTSAQIVAIDWDALVAQEAQRLQALGFEVGATVRLGWRGVFLTRDPLAVELGRMTVALRRAHARVMHVDPLPIDLPVASA